MCFAEVTPSSRKGTAFEGNMKTYTLKTDAGAITCSSTHLGCLDPSRTTHCLCRPGSKQDNVSDAASILQLGTAASWCPSRRGEVREERGEVTLLPPNGSCCCTPVEKENRWRYAVLAAGCFCRNPLELSSSARTHMHARSVPFFLTVQIPSRSTRQGGPVSTSPGGGGAVWAPPRCCCGGRSIPSASCGSEHAWRTEGGVPRCRRRSTRAT